MSIRNDLLCHYVFSATSVVVLFFLSVESTSSQQQPVYQSPEEAFLSRMRTPQWVEPDTTAPAGTQYRLFYSETIKGDVSYLVYLPPGYETNSDKRYPVIFWLHGGGGGQRGGGGIVRRMDSAMKRKKAPAMIVILVNGLPYSEYSNSLDGKWPVEDVIIRDLLPHVDQTYRTYGVREGRAVEGMSMIT